MERYITKHKKLQKLINKNNDINFFRVNDLLVIRENGNIYIVSDKNNVITYDFSINVEENLDLLFDMDIKNNSFCQDCVNCRNCYNLVSGYNQTNLRGSHV